MNETLKLVLETLRVVNKGQEALKEQLQNTIELLQEEVNKE